jgi:hypothetical protein
MVSCPVPGWVQILQALAVPVIAAVGAWVAIQQMRIARIKLQHDLYDRRYAVFQAVRRFLDEALANQLVSSETLRAFVLGTSDAEFLLPDDLAEYLARMRERARTAQSIYMVMPALLPGSQQLADASRAANEHMQWLGEQVEGLSARFRPSLKLDKQSRSPLGWLW